MPSWRTAPLPPGWDRIRDRILDRDRHCLWPDDGTPHGGRLEVDHIGDPNDHSDGNLRTLCHDHHKRRTAAQGGRAAQRRAHTRRRPRDRHPGDHPP